MIKIPVPKAEELKPLTGDQLHEKVKEVKYLYKRGDISRANAEFVMDAYLAEMNERGRRIAREHKRKHIPLTFTRLMH